MHPAIRSQADSPAIGEAASMASALFTPEGPEQDLTRQEFKMDSDVNEILGRYGVDSPVQARIPQFGEVDWDLDLHSAHIAFSNAQRAFYELPEVLQEKYKGTGPMLDAMNSGELARDLQAIRDEADKPSPEPDSPAPTPPVAPPQQ